MRKSQILNALTFESASVVNLIVHDEDSILSLSGNFSPMQAMRMIKKLPAKFHYSYISID